MSHVYPTGWFADLAAEDERVESAPWQPFLQIPGSCVGMTIWFQTEADCEDFIRREILGQPMLEHPK